MSYRSSFIRLGLIGAVMVSSLGLGAREAAADVPAAWEKRQNVCDSLSFYSVNPAHNPGAEPSHMLGMYKRLYFTTGEVINGWVPVYSAGQEEWHTGWVRGECLVAGWPHEQGGSVIW